MEIDEWSDARDLSETEIEEIMRLNVKLQEAVKFRELVWRKKSRMIWLKEGDSNTSFFHRAIKIRAKKKIVYGMKIEDSWYCDPNKLIKEMYNLFSGYLSSQSRNRVWMRKEVYCNWF